MDSTPTIQMRGFKYPQVKPIKMTLGHCEFSERFPIKIESSKFRCILLILARLLLIRYRNTIQFSDSFLEFLHCASTFIIMKYFAHLGQQLLLHFLYVVLMMLQSIIELYEWVHRLLVQILFGRVCDLHIESDWNDIEYILFNIVAIPCQHMK